MGLRQGVTCGEAGETGGLQAQAILLHRFWISLPPAWLARFADLIAPAYYCILGGHGHVGVGGCWWTCCANAISAGCGTAHFWIFDTRTRCRDEVGFGVAAPVVVRQCPAMCRIHASIHALICAPTVCPSVGPSSACPSVCVYVPLHIGCACVCLCLARQGSSGSCFGHDACLAYTVCRTVENWDGKGREEKAKGRMTSLGFNDAGGWCVLLYHEDGLFLSPLLRVPRSFSRAAIVMARKIRHDLGQY